MATELDHDEYNCECDACMNYVMNIFHDREMEWTREVRSEVVRRD